MGCRPSSSSKKESNIPTKLKPCRTSIRETANHLERILNGNGENLVGRFDLDSADLVFDLSSNHILFVDHQNLRLIHIETKTIETILLPFNIQDIVWSTKLNAFLLLGLDRIYQTKTDRLQLNVIDQIQVRRNETKRNRKNRRFFPSSPTKDIDDLIWPLTETIYSSIVRLVLIFDIIHWIIFVSFDHFAFIKKMFTFVWRPSV